MEPYVDKCTVSEGETFVVTNRMLDKHLAGFFLLMDKDGLLPVVYHQAVPEIRNWLDWHADPQSIWLACLIEKDGVANIAGMMWVTGVEQRGPAVRVAEVGHCFLVNYQHSEIPAQFVTMGLRYIFGRCGISLLVGTTPVINRAAIRFISKCGFTVTPPIDGYTSWGGRPCAAVLSYLSHETWMSRQAEQERIGQERIGQDMADPALAAAGSGR